MPSVYRRLLSGAADLVGGYVRQRRPQAELYASSVRNSATGGCVSSTTIALPRVHLDCARDDRVITEDVIGGPSQLLRPDESKRWWITRREWRPRLPHLSVEVLL